MGVVDGGLHAVAADGATFEARLPFEMRYDGVADPLVFAASAVPPDRWGVLLVRKGGFAVALMADDKMVAHKVGHRHVQGRTKAGGQSQQRFARRRENQARVAFEAAAEHAVRVLATDGGSAPLPVVLGGDRMAVRDVLSDPRLSRLSPVGAILSVREPKRQVLDAAVREAQGIRITVTNAA
jgi:hypothetical protein